MLLNNGSGDGEPEAGALVLFSGEEGIEDAVDDRVGDAMAGVGHHDLDSGGAASTP